MKIAELSIGDWVNQKMNDGAHQVQWIEREMVGLIKHTGTEEDGSIRLMAVPLSFIEPIPLTPKILEKNGFVRKDKYRFVNIDILSTVEKYGTKYYDYHNIYKKGKTYRPISVEADNIRYVHELQHAMRLAGIEKDIEV